MNSQKEIIQNIVNLVLAVIEPGWVEFTINYQVEGARSQEVNSYLIEEDGLMREKSMPFIPELNRVMRELRSHLSQDGEEFTRCVIRTESTGKFNTEYSYDPVDWSESASWNYNVNN